MRVILAAVLIIISLGAWIVIDQGVKGELRQSLKTANDTIVQKDADIKAKDAEIALINTIRQEREKAQSELQIKLGEQKQLAADRQRKWEILKHENETLQAWADADLPDAVRELRQRPAISSTADYRKWLSGSDTVPSAVQQPVKE